MVETNVVNAEDEKDAGSSQEDEDEMYSSIGRERVDLTVEQASVNDEDALDEMDDFDLLEASIDPSDVKSLSKRSRLEEEIEYEQIFIKSKLLYKLAMSEANPMKIDE